MNSLLTMLLLPVIASGVGATAPHDIPKDCLDVRTACIVKIDNPSTDFSIQGVTLGFTQPKESQRLVQNMNRDEGRVTVIRQDSTRNNSKSNTVNPPITSRRPRTDVSTNRATTDRQPTTDNQNTTNTSDRRTTIAPSAINNNARQQNTSNATLDARTQMPNTRRTGNTRNFDASTARRAIDNVDNASSGRDSVLRRNTDRNNNNADTSVQNRGTNNQGTSVNNRNSGLNQNAGLNNQNSNFNQNRNNNQSSSINNQNRNNNQSSSINNQNKGINNQSSKYSTSAYGTEINGLNSEFSRMFELAEELSMARIERLAMKLEFEALKQQYVERLRTIFNNRTSSQNTNNQGEDLILFGETQSNVVRQDSLNQNQSNNNNTAGFRNNTTNQNNFRNNETNQNNRNNTTAHQNNSLSNNNTARNNNNTARSNNFRNNTTNQNNSLSNNNTARNNNFRGTTSQNTGFNQSNASLAQNRNRTLETTQSGALNANANNTSDRISGNRMGGRFGNTRRYNDSYNNMNNIMDSNYNAYQGQMSSNYLPHMQNSYNYGNAGLGMNNQNGYNYGNAGLSMNNQSGYNYGNAGLNMNNQSGYNSMHNGYNSNGYYGNTFGGMQNNNHDSMTNSNSYNMNNNYNSNNNNMQNGYNPNSYNNMNNGYNSNGYYGNTFGGMVDNNYDSMTNSNGYNMYNGYNSNGYYGNFFGRALDHNNDDMTNSNDFGNMFRNFDASQQRSNRQIGMRTNSDFNQTNRNLISFDNIDDGRMYPLPHNSHRGATTSSRNHRAIQAFAETEVK